MSLMLTLQSSKSGIVYLLIYILSKIVLAGSHDLLSLAIVAELSWACDPVLHLIL